jgi:hypothetical protein
MVNVGQQNRMRRIVERLFYKGRYTPLHIVEQELRALGFTETGADSFAQAYENQMMELYLEVTFNEDHSVHSYLVIPFTEKEKQRRHYRW